MPHWDIDPRFATRHNADVFAFLQQHMPSAHSDVAEELILSGRGLEGVASYCPDSARYAFVVLHRADWSIFGLAYGQSALAYRVPEHRHEQALREGALAARELGSGWLFFKPWSDETLTDSRRRLARWCAIARGIVPV